MLKNFLSRRHFMINEIYSREIYKETTEYRNVTKIKNIQKNKKIIVNISFGKFFIFEISDIHKDDTVDLQLSMYDLLQPEPNEIL
tara:strand:+ start:73 stop:327 length:255 start_codon:yes stop_codon:yes gene_type:complete